MFVAISASAVDLIRAMFTLLNLLCPLTLDFYTIVREHRSP